MEQQLFDLLWEGMKDLMGKANLGFMTLNILWVFIIRMAGKKSFKKKTPTKLGLFLKTIPPAYFVIFQSVILAILWAYLFSYETKEQAAELFFSITLSMIVWKLGVQKLVNKLTKK